MVIILPRHETAGGRIGRGAAEGFTSGVKEASEERKKMKELQFAEEIQKRKEARKNEFDKLERKSAADFLESEYKIKGAENFPIEFSKAIIQSKEKERIQGQKQQQLNDLIGKLGLEDNEQQGFSPQGQQSNPQSQLEMGQQEFEEPIKKSPSKKKLIPENIIAQAAAVNPAVADKLQKHNDNIIAQERHNENLAFKKGQGQTKEVRDSYKENEPFINKTYDQYEDSLRKDAITDRMGQLEESGELSDSGVVNLLESIGLKPEWLKNPANEEYNKLSLDLLGGGTLQADYGSRVLASEFKVSQQRIPTLSLTPEGRRQIRENIQTMLLPAKLKKERMQFYLDRSERTGEPLPHNLRGKILKDIQPELEEAYDKFKQRNGRYKVKEGTNPDDNAIEKYYYLSDGNEDKALKLMKEDGYDIGLKSDNRIEEAPRKRARFSTKF